MRLVTLVGSLRASSYNRMAFNAARALAPAGFEFEEARYDDLPLYNDDVRAVAFPAAATRIGAQIAAADGVLIVSPEYNYSVPGPLKNAIDWVSRLPDQPFKGKPTAVMGASMGNLGTARMQYHLRQSMVFLDALMLTRPEVMIAQAQHKFDAQGRLTDEATAKAIRGLLEAFGAWIERLAAGARPRG